eukprot:1187841-Prorocentrum_minimum.AAC.2
MLLAGLSPADLGHYTHIAAMEQTPADLVRSVTPCSVNPCSVNPCIDNPCTHCTMGRVSRVLSASLPLLAQEDP